MVDMGRAIFYLRFSAYISLSIVLFWLLIGLWKGLSIGLWKGFKGYPVSNVLLFLICAGGLWWTQYGLLKHSTIARISAIILFLGHFLIAVWWIYIMNKQTDPSTHKWLFVMGIIATGYFAVSGCVGIANLIKK